MQSSIALLVLALAPCPASAMLFMSGLDRLQPQVVAVTLVKMEDEWRTQADLFAECNATLRSNGKPSAACGSAVKAFEKSCSTVVSAVQRASSGDRSVVAEYMGDVCGQAVLEGWRKERCQSLASTITGAMSADNYGNREDLDVNTVCQNYWSNFAAAETARVGRERAEAEVKRVAKEAEEKKLAEERAEVAKKAAEEAAKKEQQRKAAEAVRKQAEEKAEEKRKSEEAKQKAEKEAADLKAKEELAVRKAEEAQKRMEEAKAAAEQARQKHAAIAAKVNATSAAVVKTANTTHTANATKTVAK